MGPTTQRKQELGTKEKQSEFFSEFPTADTAGSSRPLAGPGRKVALQLSHENTIFIFIIFIMLLVIFFALGVERGKRAVQAKPRVEKTGRATREIQTSKKAEETVAVAPVVLPSAGLPRVQGPATATTDTAAAAPYTIQVISYKEKTGAEKERERLINKGYEAFIIRSDGWFQICVGKYANRESATKDFDALGNLYPTRYFRRINR